MATAVGFPVEDLKEVNLRLLSVLEKSEGGFKISVC